MDIKKEYWGPDEIESKEEKNINGKDYIILKFVSGVYETVSKKAFDSGVTNEVSDLTNLRTRKSYPVVNAILEVLADYNVKLLDLNSILDLVAQSLNHNLDEAIDFKLNSNQFNRTMLDIENVLQEKNKKLTINDVINKES